MLAFFVVMSLFSTTYFPCLFCDVTFLAVIFRVYSVTSLFLQLFSVFIFVT